MDSSEGHNLRSDRWIAINLLLEFPDALFHGVDEESILGDDEVWSSHAGWMVRKGQNWSFRMPFSMQRMRNRYSVMMRSGPACLK